MDQIDYVIRELESVSRHPLGTARPLKVYLCSLFRGRFWKVGLALSLPIRSNAPR